MVTDLVEDKKVTRHTLACKNSIYGKFYFMLLADYNTNILLEFQ